MVYLMALLDSVVWCGRKVYRMALLDNVVWCGKMVYRMAMLDSAVWCVYDGVLHGIVRQRGVMR
jgi:hypothetical protein